MICIKSRKAARDRGSPQTLPLPLLSGPGTLSIPSSEFLHSPLTAGRIVLLREGGAYLFQCMDQTHKPGDREEPSLARL